MYLIKPVIPIILLDELANSQDSSEGCKMAHGKPNLRTNKQNFAIKGQSAAVEAIIPVNNRHSNIQEYIVALGW